MNERRVGFGITAAISGFLSLQAALLPIGVLRGKYPDASSDRIVHWILIQTLPALAPALILMGLAIWLFTKNGPVWLWLPLFVVAPLAALIIQATFLRA
jgi:hypothetical protein